MDGFEAALKIMPSELRTALEALSQETKSNAEEIRLRAGQTMGILYKGRELIASNEHIITQRELERVLECASGGSLHSVQPELKKGFLYVEGGLRIGICGAAVIKGGEIEGFRSISSLSIRIPREIISCALSSLSEMTADGIKNILIISPPGGGKTTCLRSFIRALSNEGHRVSVADERGEISAVSLGLPQFDIGTHTDVIFDAPKAEAAMLLIRSMNPEILAMDEISSGSDIDAVLTACGCGVKLISTAHAEGLEELTKRPVYKSLIDARIFDYCLIIKNSDGQRSYEVRKLS